LSVGEGDALFAIQKLLHATNYKGNEDAIKVAADDYKYFGYLPVLKFTLADFKWAFGVATFTRNDGRTEFSVEGSRQAIAALLSLAKRVHLINFRYAEWDEDIPTDKRTKKNAKYRVVKTTDTLIKVAFGWENLTEEESEKVIQDEHTPGTDKKSNFIAIRPSILLINQLNDYYLMKHADYRQRIKKLVKRRSKYLDRFIDFLILTASKKSERRTKQIRIGWKDLAYKVGFADDLNRRKISRARSRLIQCYEIAKEANYLRSFEIDKQGKTAIYDVLNLNPEMFYYPQGKKK